MMDLRSDKAKYVREQAPVSCHIQFICQGHLIFTRMLEIVEILFTFSLILLLMQVPYQNRGANADAETETGISNNRKSRSVSWGHSRDTSKIGQSLRSQSVSEKNSNRSSGGRGLLDISFPEGTEELASPKSLLDVEGSSDEREYGLSRSPPHLGSSTCSSRRGAEDENVKISSPLHQPSPSWISACSSSTGALSDVDGSLYVNTLYEKLQRAWAEAEKEILRRQKAERDLIEALCRAHEELIQRKTEEALAKEREMEEVKNQRNQAMEELRSSQVQIAELQKGMDELQVERDNALKEAQGLRRKQEGSMRDRLPFSEFSLSEIEEATHSFNESMKIGEGGYGNIYKGILHQTKVAIKKLHSQSIHSHVAQGPSEFQMEVRVLSQLRHPNLVKLIGSCPEAFALIYEYVPNGSLEDRLSCKDNSPPLSWQTRLLTGRPPFLIANEVEDSLDAGNLKTLLDPLAGEWPIALAQELARLGLRCCDRKRKSRPNLGSDVWKVLEPLNTSCAADQVLTPAGSCT
ncbi:U-box domain-containing protein 70-like [Corylus avellana]|uniref:U-box domain-containing protein 70-like n=1 Tax=Corylus avellana TaxID=13451 RepID=UPI00286B8BFC|nr:U-box domain-containing protein 70-like [Corylus avellana]